MIFFLFFSCSHNNSINNFKIISPLPDWIYDDETSIVFSINNNSETIMWESSIDGTIGYGSDFVKVLSAGKHRIRIKSESGHYYDSVNITVNECKENQKSYKLITEFPVSINPDISSTNYGLISLNGTAQNISLNNNQPDNNKTINNQVNNNFVSYTGFYKKDISIKNEIKKLSLVSNYAKRNISENEISRLFFVANTTSIGNTYHEQESIKYFNGTNISVWIPKDNSLDCSEIDKCINKIEQIIIPRVNDLWGNCADINNDGKISILFCPTINQEQKAIGFFNSKDFFKRDTMMNSESYNPYSNEMDLIYVAIPDEINSNYNTDSIVATVAHEYTHAVNFSNKTWKYFYRGEQNYNQEETFLDEGWSHLTESLCGFGTSGGNSNFVNYYLNNPALFSLCKNDYMGNSDSIGQRGAVCMFLYWLFNKAGGFDYNENGINFIDKGGISFLRAMINTRTTGWDSIGEYFNKQTNTLFLEFSQELLSIKTTELFDETIIDPVTYEKQFECNDLNYYTENFTFNILPWSIIPFSISYPVSPSYELEGNKLNGTIYMWNSI